MGFGFPVAILSAVSPKFIDSGVFALVFPLCILTASVAQPVEWKNDFIGRLPIFAVAQKISCNLLKLLETKKRY